MLVTRDEPLTPAPEGPRRFRTTATARQAAAERRRLERDLHGAVQRGAFTLHYQPRLCLATGAVRGAEALIRWPYRKHGVVPASVFIPVAERCSLITEIGGWVLRTACAEAASWPGLGVSVNISARQLQDGALLDQLAAALAASGLPPERLELELAETLLAESGAETLLALSAIRDLGIGLALDDFGADCTSVSMLKRLPLTTLKLNRSLVRELPGNREDAAIVRAMVEIGRAMSLTVVAVGIETEAQRAFLSGLGCDEGQGYLFSHPLPPPEFHGRVLR